MYREESEEQQKIEDFYLPIGGHLDKTNRGEILSTKIPWDKNKSDYARQFSSSRDSAAAKSIRMALGALNIKEKLQISDEEVVAQIKENPFLQFFTDIESYKNDCPFDASLMVHFRKRLNARIMQKANEILFR